MEIESKMSKTPENIGFTDKLIPEKMSHRGMTAVINLNSSKLLSRNIRIHGRRTSIRLDDRMWYALNEISATENCSVHEICSAVYDHKDDDNSMSAAIRIFLMNYYRIQAKNKN